MRFTQEGRPLLLCALFVLLGSTLAYGVLDSLLDPGKGGELTSNGTTVWNADNATDGSVVGNSGGTWLCQRYIQPNHLIYRFKDATAPGGESEETFNRFDYYNYGNNRSIQKYQIFVSSDEAAKTDWLHSSWERAIPAPSVASTALANLLWPSSEAERTFVTYEHNTTSWGAYRATDGQTNTIWLGRVFPNHIIYRLNSGQPIDMNRFGLRNYGNNRSVRHFRLATSSNPDAATDPDHASWTVIMPRPGEGSQDPVDHIQPSLGGTIEYVRQQTWPVSRLTDGRTNTIFLGQVYPNQVIFSFHPDYNSGGSPLLNRLDVLNYGSTRSVKYLQMFVSSAAGARTNPTHASWVKIMPLPGEEITDPLDLISPLYDGKLEYYNHQTWPIANATDGSTGSRWLSLVYPQTLTFSFDGETAEDMNEFHLWNYNGTRSVRNFMLLYSSNAAAKTDPFHASWTPVPPSAAQGSTDLVDFLSVSYGGNVEYVQNQHSSYPATRLTDERDDTVWLGRYFPNAIQFSFKDTAAETINQIWIDNYNHNRSLRLFRIHHSNDPAALGDPNHASWTLVPAAGPFASTSPVDIISPRFGGKREYVDDEVWPADRANDGNTGTIWGGDDYPNNIIFSFDGEANRTFNTLKFANYNNNHSRCIRHFQIYASSTAAAKTDPWHASWELLPSSQGLADDANLLHRPYGATRTAACASEWSADYATDQRTDTRWRVRTDLVAAADRYLIFRLGDPVNNQAGFTPQVSSVALRNYGNSSGYCVKKLRVYVTTDDPPTPASWALAGEFDNLPQSTALQTRNFAAANAKYVKLELTENYSGNRVGLREIYLYGNKTLSDFQVWQGEQTTSFRSYVFPNTTHKYFLFRINDSFGDRYAGLREMELYGTQPLSAFGVYEIPKARGPHAVDLPAPITCKYLQLTAEGNYGDSWTGFRTLRAFGTKQAKDVNVWMAENTSGKRTYTFPATVNGRYFQFRGLQTYGDRYIGGREMKLYGTKTLGSAGVFHLAQSSGLQGVDFVPTTGKYFMLQFNESYGDRYAGLREAHLYGDEILEDRGVFGAAISSGYQEWSFNSAVSASHFRFSELRNYGDTYCGVRELYLYGTKTEGGYGVFEAERAAGWNKARFDDLTGKYFQLRTLGTWGDRYGGMREIKLIRALRLELADLDSDADETVYTNAKTVKWKLSNIDSAVTQYLLSENEDFSGATPVVIAAGTNTVSGTFVLSDEDGEKTVYAKVLDAGGTDFTTTDDKILLDTHPPDAVTNVAAEAGVGEVVLSWKQPTDLDLHGTVVRFSTTSFPTSSTSGQALPNGAGGFFYDGPGSVVSFKHEGLTNGTTYYYSLFAFDNADNYAARVEISALPRFPVERLEIQTASGATQFDTQTSGQNVQIRVVAFDENGKRVESYEGAKTLKFSSTYVTPSQGTKTPTVGGVSLPGNVPTVFSGGISQALSLKYMDAGRIKISAVDQGGTPGDPADDYGVKVPPAIAFAPVGFDLQWVKDEPPLTAGESLQLRIRAVASDGTDNDLTNNPSTPNYSTGQPGGIALSAQYVTPSTGTQAVAPATTEIGAGTNGEVTVEMTYEDAGTIQVAAQHSSYFDRVVKGSTADTLYVPASLELRFDPYPKNRTFYYAAREGEPWSGTLKALSATGAVTQNYRGTVNFESDGEAVILPEPHTFTAEEKGEFVIADGFRATAANDPLTITVSDNQHDKVEGQAQAATLYPDARIVIVGAQGPVGTLAFHVEIRQGPGKGVLVAEDISTSVDLTITSESGKLYAQSARVSADPKVSPRDLSRGARSLSRLVLSEGGRRTLYIADVEGETVKVQATASSPSLHLDDTAVGEITFTADEQRRKGMVITETYELKHPPKEPKEK